MATEIEHKYLVRNDSFMEMASRIIRIRQGYLSRDKNRTVRIRIKDNKAYLTIKTRNIGDTRHEFEYEIPYGDAEELLESCLSPVIEKLRHIVDYKGFIWEVDEFKGSLEGVIVAEIELPASGTSYELPPFAGENVTGNPVYYNSNIHLLAGKHTAP